MTRLAKGVCVCVLDKQKVQRNNGTTPMFTQHHRDSTKGSLYNTTPLISSRSWLFLLVDDFASWMIVHWMQSREESPRCCCAKRKREKGFSSDRPIASRRVCYVHSLWYTAIYCFASTHLFASFIKLTIQRLNGILYLYNTRVQLFDPQQCDPLSLHMSAIRATSKDLFICARDYSLPSVSLSPTVKDFL